MTHNEGDSLHITTINVQWDSSKKRYLNKVEYNDEVLFGDDGAVDTDGSHVINGDFEIHTGDNTFVLYFSKSTTSSITITTECGDLSSNDE